MLQVFRDEVLALLNGVRSHLKAFSDDFQELKCFLKDVCSRLKAFSDDF